VTSKGDFTPTYAPGPVPRPAQLRVVRILLTHSAAHSPQSGNWLLKRLRNMSPSRPLFFLAVILAAIAAAQPAFGVGLPQPQPLAPVAGDPTQALPGKIKFDRCES
jgi:hypothetical protein